MDALWIIDLTESEEVVKDFYTSYWNAFLENQTDAQDLESRRQPWFAVSSTKDLGWDCDTTLLQQKVNRVMAKANQLIDVHNGLIKYDFPQPDRIIVVFMGDIQSDETQRYWLPLSVNLKQNTLSVNRWNTTPNVSFYGFLYRRKEVSHGTDLTSKEKAFLNQLHNIQNHQKVFDNVLFFEKSMQEKPEAIKMMALASLHLGCGNGNGEVLKEYWNWNQPPVYLNASASGVFFEKGVQNEREAFLLGHTLMDAFVNGDGPEFLNEDAAKQYAANISVFRNNDLSSNNLYASLSNDMPEFDTNHFRFEAPIKPGSLKVHEVWNRYFNRKDGYIANLKKNLVNTVKLDIATFEKKYVDRLAEHQMLWLQEKSKAIEDGLFNLFAKENPDRYCSLHQAINVAKCAEEEARRKITKSSDISLVDEDGKLIRPIPIPKRYKDAYKTAVELNEKSANDVLNDLDRKLRKHPVFMFSMFSRALLLGILLCTFFVFSYPLLAAGVLLLPILVYFLVYRRYMNVLHSLIDQYIALSLEKLNDRLEDAYKEAISKSQNQVAEYCKWNWEKRLENLRHNLGVFIPKDFSFKAFSAFQPLVVDNLEIAIGDKYIKMQQDDSKVSAKPAMSSGAFDKKNLLNEIPGFNVKCGENSKSIMDLDEADKRYLIQNLMGCTADVFNHMEEVLDPAKMVLRMTSAVTLMLDVSGSMFGPPHDDLKQIVADLKAKFDNRVRWVAFANSAILDKDSHEDLDEAQQLCGGGTEYVPAFELIKNCVDKGDLDMGKLIIISDGCPWDTEESKRKILELGCLVDVIYIGGGNQNYLRELAESTGGKLIVVDDIKNAHIDKDVEAGITTGFKLGDEGKFSFGELLKKSAIKACMKALYGYSVKTMVINDACIEQMLAAYGASDGIRYWIDKVAPLCSLNSGATPINISVFCKSSGINQGAMEKKFQDCQVVERTLHQFKHFDLGNVSSPDLLVTLLNILPLQNGLRDLAWTIDTNEEFLLANDDEYNQWFQKVFEDTYQCTNIYGVNINCGR